MSKKESEELGEKILEGFKKAVKKVYEKAQKNGEELVVGDGKGSVITIKP
jgi:hypothetical protein